MQEQLLYTIALGLVIFLVFLWVVIGYSIIIRQSRYVTRSKIDAFFIQKLSMEYAESNALNEPTHLHNDQTIAIKLNNGRKLQYASSILIRVQDTFYSENDNMIEQVCKESGIYKEINKKIKKQNWYPKAMAIWLSYELDLKSHLTCIKPLISHKNVLVRREAQIGLVRFWGWKSLKILPQLKYPISLWQQIRIIENLMDYFPIPDLTYMNKALETQNPFGIELLIRLIRRFEMHAYKNYVIEQLAHPNKNVSETAIEVLETFDLNADQLYKIENLLTLLPTANQPIRISQLIALQQVPTNKEKQHGNN